MLADVELTLKAEIVVVWLVLIYNELLIVDALETNILEKLVLFNNHVDVDCKFEIFKVEFVERLFKFAVVARSGLFIMLSYIKLVKPEPEPII